MKFILYLTLKINLLYTCFNMLNFCSVSSSFWTCLISNWWQSKTDFIWKHPLFYMVGKKSQITGKFLTPVWLSQNIFFLQQAYVTASGCPAAWLLIKIRNSRLRKEEKKNFVLKNRRNIYKYFVKKDRLPARHQGYNKGYESSASRFARFISTFAGKKEWKWSVKFSLLAQ